ncbi:class I SAM-dependent methyltransferase [Peribacillus sp. SCS-155]|uniref:class I SAM-dependent methyltransferase n=1 Tax=Peribacillus sedimenti TaxID=3115297 RepID=UPI0039068152
MKYRQSGMPSDDTWEGFFDTQLVLKSLDITKDIKKFIDIGCGYGTFLIPASRIISGVAIGVDIDNWYLELCQKRVSDASIENIRLINGDISQLQDDSLKGADYVSLFNILHCEEPLALMKNAMSLLRDGGKIGIMHWKHTETPRGPSLDIRPKPETIIEWTGELSLSVIRQVELPPITLASYLKSEHPFI